MAMYYPIPRPILQPHVVPPRCLVPSKTVPIPSASKAYLEKVRPKPTSTQSSSSSSDWKFDWWSDWNDETWDQRYKEPDPVSKNEQLILETKKVLQRHRGGEAPVHDHEFHEFDLVCRSGKRGRSPPPKKGRMGQRSKSKRAKARYSKLMDDKQELTEVEVGALHFSQISCKDTFRCGRGVMQLVDDLKTGKVPLSAPFLTLTVFEETAKETNEPILRCIDNRRLLALKEYAHQSGKECMVNINFFSENTVKQVERYRRNSDVTNGHQLRLRSGGKNERKTNRKRRRYR